VASQAGKSKSKHADMPQHLEPGGQVCSGFLSLLGRAVLPVASTGALGAPGRDAAPACPGAQLAPAGHAASGFCWDGGVFGDAVCANAAPPSAAAKSRLIRNFGIPASYVRASSQNGRRPKSFLRTMTGPNWPLVSQCWSARVSRGASPSDSLSPCSLRRGVPVVPSEPKLPRRAAHRDVRLRQSAPPDLQHAKLASRPSSKRTTGALELAHAA
jgi:hypothetical protein